MKLYCFMPDPSAVTIEEKFYSMFMTRQRFMAANPYVPGMLWDVMQTPPADLCTRIYEIRSEFLEFYYKRMDEIIQQCGILDSHQIKLCTEIFLIASNHVYYQNIRDWNPESSPERKTLLSAAMEKNFKELIHVCLSGILSQ